MLGFAPYAVRPHGRFGERRPCERCALADVDRRLVPTDPAAAGHLTKALNDAVHDEAAAPAGGRAGLIATVLPLDRGGRQTLSQPFAAAAAVFVQDPRVVPLLPGEAFAKLYGLTASELRIVLAMSSGCRLPTPPTCLEFRAPRSNPTWRAYSIKLARRGKPI